MIETKYTLGSSGEWRHNTHVNIPELNIYCHIQDQPHNFDLYTGDELRARSNLRKLFGFIKPLNRWYQTYNKSIDDKTEDDVEYTKSEAITQLIYIGYMGAWDLQFKGMEFAI